MTFREWWSVDDVGVARDLAAQRRRRMQGGRQFRVSVRFTEEERALVQAAADEAGVTASNLVAEIALEAARKDGASVDVQVLAELQAMRRLLQAYGGRLAALVPAQSDGPDRSRVDAAARALEALGGRLIGLLDDLEGARAHHR